VPGANLSLERRVVSVLFADLVGFTARSESQDPEAVREFLTRYFEAASEVIASYGGTIEKFIGDAVMAVWGTPTAYEDDGERAVRAALDLVDAVRALGSPGAAGAHEAAKPADLVELRAAVMTGDAAVTVGATGQGMVAGDLVNACSRLQAAAAPGTVLVDETTLRAANRAIAFEPAGDQLLRGKTLPVPAWRALRVVAERGGLGRSETLEAPFVGREEELRLLKDQLLATGREGRTRLVTILGGAGMGKSRLVWEFLKWVDGVSEEIFWHQGRSPAYGEGIAYWALGEMVRRRATITEAEDDTTARRKLAAAVAEFVPDETERRWVEPRLAALLGLEEAPVGDREELFAAWRTFFERIADQGTTVLVFEDLHWADQGLLDFIESVLEWSRLRPILVIGLARPELVERRPGWLSSSRASITLHLEPVSYDGISQMLLGLAPGIPQETARHIADRAEGVPLYAVETVRMLLDDGRLVRDGERFRMVDAAAPLAVPQSLHALIAARLDAVEPEDRALLQDASVLGKTFTLTALSAVSGRDLAEIETRLRQLVRKELIELNADPRSPEYGQHGFVHGLFREIAYGTLSRRDRRERHLAAARFFEAQGDEELAGVLASHFLDAYHAAPEGPEGEAIAGQARIALKAAADRALSLHANVAALGYLEQALSVTTDPTDLAALRLQAAEPAEAAQGLEAAERYIRPALEWYRGQGDSGGINNATVRLAQVLLQNSRIAEAMPLVQAALASTAEDTEDHVVAQLYNQLARAFCFESNGIEAFAACERGLTIAERLGAETETAELFITKSWAVDILGRGREAAVLAAGGLEFGTRVGNNVTVLRARMNLSNWQMTDDPRRGMETADAGVELALRVGHHSWAARIGGNRNSCALLCGELSTILESASALEYDHLDEATTLGLVGGAAAVEALRGTPGRWTERLATSRVTALASQSSQDREGIRSFLIWQAFASGDLAEAARLGRESTEEAASGEAIMALSFAIRAALWLGARTEAVFMLDRQKSRGDTGGWLAASRRASRAGLLALDGEMAGAAVGFREAIEAFRKLRVTLEVGIALMDLRGVIGGADPEAADVEGEARAIFESMGTVHLLERLESVTLGREPAAAVAMGTSR
jgi:class 3 adenylate cyclase